MKQVAEELGIGYAVEGSVRKDGNRVRITTQLSDAATGTQIWAERYDRDLVDVFAVQDEITEAIVAAIEPQLYAAENFRANRRKGGPSALATFNSARGDRSSVRLPWFERHSLFDARRPDCVAGHIGLEPANPSASYLIGFA